MALHFFAGLVDAISRVHVRAAQVIHHIKIRQAVTVEVAEGRSSGPIFTCNSGADSCFSECSIAVVQPESVRSDVAHVDIRKSIDINVTDTGRLTQSVLDEARSSGDIDKTLTVNVAEKSVQVLCLSIIHRPIASLSEVNVGPAIAIKV